MKNITKIGRIRQFNRDFTMNIEKQRRNRIFMEKKLNQNFSS